MTTDETPIDERQAVTPLMLGPWRDPRPSAWAAPPTPCPYLPEREERSEGFVAADLRPEDYELLMGCGFRRSGRVFYRPRCGSCLECVPLRVPVQRFRQADGRLRSRSWRRIWRMNREIRVEVGGARAHERQVRTIRALPRLSAST